MTDKAESPPIYARMVNSQKAKYISVVEHVLAVRANDRMS